MKKSDFFNYAIDSSTLITVSLTWIGVGGTKTGSVWIVGGSQQGWIWPIVQSKPRPRIRAAVVVVVVVVVKLEILRVVIAEERTEFIFVGSDDPLQAWTKRWPFDGVVVADRDGRKL